MPELADTYCTLYIIMAVFVHKEAAILYNTVELSYQDTLKSSDDTLTNRAPCNPIYHVFVETPVIMMVFRGPKESRLELHARPAL